MSAQHPRRRAATRAAVASAATLAALAGLVYAPDAMGTGTGTTVTAGPAVTANDGARVVSETWLGDRTVDLQIQSPAVGKTVPTRVLLPEGWSADADRTWPVLYLLHGGGDDYDSWTRETDIEEFMAGRDVITVMPSAGRTGITAKWQDGKDYVTFQADELAQLLQRGYRAGTDRAVGGISTGGYAAFALAAQRPGTFDAAASYSGILHTQFPGVPTLLTAILAREGLLAGALWGYPFLSWSTWQANNPYNQVEKLRGTSLYISAGSGLLGSAGDLLGEGLESALWPSTQAFAQRLSSLGIPAQTHFYSGGSHNWQYFNREFERSWPMLAEALGLPA
ncbi:alpha/beta hydrolase [Streptomyces sp. NBC_01803]|uniref:alpha/beta hydrolase n=1 Tax=Streptomyces sp. NBC_01803 TaxID=2975946 RepID=UPI002DDA0B25|nr:alpha/beta hydrolase-fold protein [Streptomyces sp. NBC_01803]WSA46159.1 esterase family protein [Streptomyces sp. NBC_01803]